MDELLTIHQDQINNISEFKMYKDLKKNNFLSSQNIHLIRVRQLPLKPLSKNDVLVSKQHSLEKKDLDNLFQI